MFKIAGPGDRVRHLALGHLRRNLLFLHLSGKREKDNYGHIFNIRGCFSSHTASTVGRIEAEGPLGACFDLIERDPYFGEESWEKAESEMVHRTLNVLLKKAAKKPEEIDLILGGDLLNQCTASTFAVQRAENPLSRPVRGLLDDAAESLLIGSSLLRAARRGPSAPCACDRLALLLGGAAVPLPAGIRRPAHPDRRSGRSTGAGALYRRRTRGQGRACQRRDASGASWTSASTDANNMGAAMAPAAVQTLLRLFRPTRARRPRTTT